MIEDDYGKEIDVPASSSLKASIVQASAAGRAGANDQIALVFLYTVDNSKTYSAASRCPRGTILATTVLRVIALYRFAAGPPTADQVSAFWSNLQQLHPKASIVASSLDAFAAEVLSGNTDELQTVTEELGDSWLYGAPAGTQF